MDYSKKRSPMKWTFKEKFTFEQRKKESTVIREKYPDKIPIIAQKSLKSNLKDLEKYKLLIPYEVTVAQLMYLLRDRLELTQRESIYLFIDRTLPQSSALVGELYYRHKDADGFLYVMFSEENTFGFCTMAMDVDERLTKRKAKIEKIKDRMSNSKERFSMKTQVFSIGLFAILLNDFFSE